MATSDGESCSAEDRALSEFESKPWSDADGDWFVARYREAFRAGFRAGQEHPKPGRRWGDGFAAGVEDHSAMADVNKRLLDLEAKNEGIR